MNRRDFLTTMTAAALLTAANPLQSTSKNRRTLMVIELAGGNDGLNMFVPYKDPNYRKLRPNLAIADGIPVSDTVALHPALKELKPILESDRLAVVQNVSYPNPNLSHFRSKDIWQSAHPSGSTDTGWLARYLESNKAKTADAIFLGEEYPLALMGASTERYLQLSPRLAVRSSGKLGQAIQAVYATPQSMPLAERVRRTVLESEAAVKKIASEIKQRSASHGYAKTPIGQKFALAGRLLESNLRILYITIGGWDTHAGQAQRHHKLLEQLSLGLAALDRDLKARGKDKEVLIMVQSEFGRRPAQNGSGGTDHGTTGPVLLLGSVKSGFYGGNPSLDSLEKGNLPVKVDFRSIYAEILQRWDNQDPKPILGQSFNFVGVLS